VDCSGDRRNPWSRPTWWRRTSSAWYGRPATPYQTSDVSALRDHITGSIADIFYRRRPRRKMVVQPARPKQTVHLKLRLGSIARGHHGTPVRQHVWQQSFIAEKKLSASLSGIQRTSKSVVIPGLRRITRSSQDRKRCHIEPQTLTSSRHGLQLSRHQRAVKNGRGRLVFREAVLRLPALAVHGATCQQSSAHGIRCTSASLVN
jgi:hypothetical protein